MENATKALMIAGGILIGILVITLAVYTFLSASEVGNAYSSEQARREIAMYNNKFEQYNINEKTGMLPEEYLTIYDILSAINLAEE